MASIITSTFILICFTVHNPTHIIASRIVNRGTPKGLLKWCFVGPLDIFVIEELFEKAKGVLYDLCDHHSDLDVVPPREQNSNCKLEIKKGEKEIFSVIPVFVENDLFRFKYQEKYGGDVIYSIQDLVKIERNISGHQFFTSTKRLIVQKFSRHLAARQEKLNRGQ